MILLYRIITNLLYPFLVIFIYLRKKRKKEDPVRFREKIFSSHFNVEEKKNDKLFWFHAASIGEVKSIVPIINELNSDKRKFKFLITTTTLSSSEIAKNELKGISNTYHRFFPLDVNFLIEQFLKKWKPDIIFLVDSEIWPNLIFGAKKFGVPMVLINARITAKTSKRWMRFPGVAKKIFNSFSLCLASNLETKNFLKNLEVKNVKFYGNIKLAYRIDVNKIKNKNKNILVNKRFWLAASTHVGEDEFCLKTHLLLKKKYSDIISIIAPRHIRRSKDIKALSETFNLNTQILNKDERIEENKEIIIINSFGILQDYFKYTKSVFMGKSILEKLKKVGGQNPIDAAKLGCKIYHGPYIYNFEEVYKILEKNNISSMIKSPEELSANLVKDLSNIQKENEKISYIINSLGEKTLIDTMEEIKKFTNEIK